LNELELEKRQAEHKKKVAQLTSQRIDFKKDKAFKRQNSYTPALDEFGDIDDIENMHQAKSGMR